MRHLSALLIVLLALGACADNDYRAEEPVSAAEGAPPGAPEPASKEANAALDDGRAAQQRKVYYEGTIDLETSEPEATLAKATAKVKALGGYAELETKDTVVLHVPVAKFLATFDEVQALGRVLKKNLTGADITEAFNDTALRKQLIEASLKKLEQLLAQAKSASERLALLKEIGELKARLEETEALLALLSHKSEFSKLTLTTVAPARAIAALKPRPIGVFTWIDRLSPESSLARQSGKKMELVVPADFVVVPNGRYWLTESASQATFSATRLANDPKGDAAFWLATLKERLKARFTVTGTVEQGAFQVLRLQDPAGEGYRYDVGILTDGDSLVVAEAVYPTAADEKRFSGKVFAALDSYKGKGH